MTESRKIGVIVRDSDIRDLISLNLRFESFVTRNFDDLKSFLSSGDDVAVLILDIAGEREPRVLVERIRENRGTKFPVLLLSDRGTPTVEDEREILVESREGRKRFDAVLLISHVKELFEKYQEEPLKHPLTGLPSGAAVERYINGLIADGGEFALIVSDLDNMKAFNQRFGYSRGDDLLCCTVKIIGDVLNDYPHKVNFMGHRGEDDFVIITSPESARAVGEKIVDRFDDMIDRFFGDEEFESGFFTIRDRRGNDLKFPLTTLSLVIIFTAGRRFLHPAELYDAADEIMTEVKTRGINQSYCAVEQPNNKPEKKNTIVF